jgi:hypothetical protein
MRRLGFDFAVQRKAHGWAGWLLLAFAAIFVADLGRQYLSLQTELERMEARLPRLDEPEAKVLFGQRPPSIEELAAARAVVARFAAPWPSLFSAIESVKVDDVALLSIEPDAGSGQVLITGEAKDYLALLTYVAHLGAHPGFTRVHLSRYEVRDSQPRRPIAFSVLAQWRRG